MTVLNSEEGKSDTLSISAIQFGKIDARNEVFRQTREDSRVFYNSYTMPPGVSVQSFMSGARYFILGQKGSGKTALIWYLKQTSETQGGYAEVILFKSDLTEVERQRLITLDGSAKVFEDQNSIVVQYDYKTNWIWFIVRALVRMIRDEDILIGEDLVHDLRNITGVKPTGKQSMFSGLQFTKIKGSIEAGIKTGVFRTGMKTELEGAFKPSSDADLLETITVCERALAGVQLKNNRSCRLLFDELELFYHKEDQRDRDLSLIRDLLYAVSRINRNLGEGNTSFFIYASVRSEIMEEVNRIGPETKRDVTDFGVTISWDAPASLGKHPILKVIEAKITASEQENGVSISEDVWRKYFPSNIFGREIRQYLLDISMFKPRNLVRRLRLAQDNQVSSGPLQEDAFKLSSSKFSGEVWGEMEEELLASYNPKQVRAIKAVLSGFEKVFTIVQLRNRIDQLSAYDPNVSNQIRSMGVAQLATDLYRVGAIGNIFRASRENRSNNVRHDNRDRWIFRNYPEPLLDEKFIVHESLHKNFQL